MPSDQTPPHTQNPPPQNTAAGTRNAPSLALFYGSSTCYTEMAGEKIAQKLSQLLGRENAVAVFNIADEDIATAESYDCLIFGIPTWDYGELQEDWEEIWDALDSVNLTDKPVALFGLGDQVGYPEWFLDAMGYLHTKLVNQGGRPCGYWRDEGYEYETSQAMSPDGQSFVGLALDDENEFDLTDDRIDRWCRQILSEFGLS